MSDQFEKDKQQSLATLDLFITHAQEGLGPVDGTDGGTLDLPLVPFLREINELPLFYTKSSCIGHNAPEMWMCLCGCNAPAAQHETPFLAIEVLPERFEEIWKHLAEIAPVGYVILEDFKASSGIIFYAEKASYKEMFEHIVGSLKKISRKL